MIEVFAFYSGLLTIIILQINSKFHHIFLYWGLGGNTTEKDFKKINRVVKCASRLTGIDQDTFQEIFICTCINKFRRILRDPSHPLYQQINFSNRSGRILFLKTKKERYKMSFLPYAIKLYSSFNQRQTTGSDEFCKLIIFLVQIIFI